MLAGEVLTQYEGSNFKWATNESERNKLWTARHHAFYAVLATKPNSRASLQSALHLLFSMLLGQMKIQQWKIWNGKNVLAKIGHGSLKNKTAWVETVGKVT